MILVGDSNFYLLLYRTVTVLTGVNLIKPAWVRLDFWLALLSNSPEGVAGCVATITDLQIALLVAAGIHGG